MANNSTFGIHCIKEIVKFIKNKFERSYYNSFKCLRLLILIVSILIIILLRLTNFRLFEIESISNNLSNDQYADRLNEILFTLSVSYVAAYIFFITNDYLPYVLKKEIDRGYVISSIAEISKILTTQVQRQIFFIIEDDSKDSKKNNFVNKFTSMALCCSSGCSTSMVIYHTYYEEYSCIKASTKELLNQYGRILKYDEYRKLIYLWNNYELPESPPCQMRDIGGKVEIERWPIEKIAYNIYNAYLVFNSARFRFPEFPYDQEMEYLQLHNKCNCRLLRKGICAGIIENN